MNKQKKQLVLDPAIEFWAGRYGFTFGVRGVTRHVVAIDEVPTPEILLAYVYQLMQHEWITREMLLEFLHSACGWIAIDCDSVSLRCPPKCTRARPKR